MLSMFFEHQSPINSTLFINHFINAQRTSLAVIISGLLNIHSLYTYATPHPLLQNTHSLWDESCIGIVKVTAHCIEQDSSKGDQHENETTYTMYEHE